MKFLFLLGFALLSQGGAEEDLPDFSSLERDAEALRVRSQELQGASKELRGTIAALTAVFKEASSRNAAARVGAAVAACPAAARELEAGLALATVTAWSCSNLTETLYDMGLLSIRGVDLVVNVSSTIAYIADTRAACYTWWPISLVRCYIGRVEGIRERVEADTRELEEVLGTVAKIGADLEDTFKYCFERANSTLTDHVDRVLATCVLH